ncbi:LPS translocon maturation chaperone LptM [Teredinibacter sp. KSP-S5-2]
MSRIAIYIVITLLACSLSSCGQKGPLRLPAEPVQQEQQLPSDSQPADE